MLDSDSFPRARSFCKAEVMYLKVVLSIVLLHSSKLVHAQAGVIDDSQYIAGPQQRAATRASRRTPVPANNATSHAPTLAPTVASPGVPMSTLSVPQHTNITAVQQPLSIKASSPGVGPVQAVQAKAAAGNATGAGHASLRPANRYQNAPPPPEHVDVTVKQQHPSENASSPGVGSAQDVHAKAAAKNSTTAAHASVTPANRYQSAPPLPLAAKKAANETASRRAPVGVPAKVAPPSANDTSSGVGSAPALHAKAAARNATGQQASLRPANRYQTTPPPPHAAKNAAKAKAGGGAVAPASAQAAQQEPLAGVPAQQPSTVPLQPDSSDEAGSAASASPDSGVGAPLSRSAAPPDVEHGALPAGSPWMMAASPRQEPALAGAPLLADSPALVAAETPVPAQAPLQADSPPLAAAEAPVPAQAPMVAAGVPQSAARAPTSVEAPILASNLSQAAAAGPDLAPAPAPAAVEPIPESVMGTTGPIAETPAPALASAPAAVTAPEPARRHPEPGMAPAAVLQNAAQVSAPVPAAGPAPEPATSREEPDMAYASALQSPAVAPAPATVAEPATEHATSRTPPAAFLQGTTLAPAPGAQVAPVAAAPAEAPLAAVFPTLNASAALGAPVEAPGVAAIPPLDAPAAAMPAEAPGVAAFPPTDASAAAASAEAPRGAAFPPLDASPAAGTPVEAPGVATFPPLDASAPASPVGQPHHGALQVALAQPAHTAAPPPKSAPSPATGGHTTQAAAGSNSRAAALRQTIGVVQASVLSNRALPALPPSTAAGVQALELAEAPATASAEAPAPLQEPPSARQPTAAGPAEAGSPAPSDAQEAATVAEAPRGNDAVLPSTGVGGVGKRSAVQTSKSETVAVRPAGEGLPGDNAAFFSTTGVLQPDAATPGNSTSTGLVQITFKSQALTSQLFRAAPASGEHLVLQPPAAAYAPAPVSGVQSLAYGGYSRLVDINVAQSAQQAAQAPVLGPAYAPSVGDIAGAPGPAVADLQPRLGAYKVAAAPEAAGSLLGDQASAMPAPKTTSFRAAEAPSPGQKALEELLSAASPHTQPGQAQAFTSGYFDVWAAPAPCDGFFSIRARRAPLGVQPSPQHSGGAKPASRYGGAETRQPVSPVRPSVPAPAPGRSLSLHPLGAQTVLAPGPAPMQLTTAQPNQAPIAHAPSETHMAPAAREPSQVALGYAPSPAAAYHAGYYAGLQAAQTARAAATSAPAPAPSEAATSAATSPATSTITMALAAAPALARPPAKEPRQQSPAQAPIWGVYGYYGGYVTRAPAAQGAEVAHAPVVREYPAEGMPAPVAAPGPSEGMLVHAVSPASYGKYETRAYANAQRPRSSTDVRPAEALEVQAYAPAAAQPAASPYARYGAAAPRGAYSMYGAHPQAYYVHAKPYVTTSSAPAPGPAVFQSGTELLRTAPASATVAPPDTPLPAPSVAAALSPEAAITGQPTAEPALAPYPGAAPVPSALHRTTRASVSSALAPTPATAPEAAVAPAYAIATSSALAYAPAPVPSAFDFTTHAAVTSALAPTPTTAPEAAGGQATATSPPAYAPASAPVPSAVPRTSHATVTSALAPAPAITEAPTVAPAHASATSAPAYAPAPHGHALAAGLALNTAVAPSPVQGPQQSPTQAGTQSACSKCAAYGADRPPSVQMSMSDGSELAQFSTSDGVPSNVVYFVADVAFSPAPLSFTPQQISAANGTIIDVYQEDDCGHYLVKGYVEQPESGDPMRTDIVPSISDGAVFDCNGEAFPGTTLTSSVLNRPTGSLHTPSLIQSASGPVSNQSQVFLTLTFSQPVSSVSPADISVKLTQTRVPATQAVSGMAAPTAGGQNRRRLAEVPALSPAEAACKAVHALTMLQKPDSPQAAFEFLLDISDCFLGVVGVDFIGTVHNSNGAENLPVSSLQFWQVNAKQSNNNVDDSSMPQ